MQAIGVLLLLILVGGCHRPASKPEQTVPAPQSTETPRKSAAVLPPDVWRGVCYAHSWEQHGRAGYGSPESEAALDHLQSLGVNWVSITPFGFMGDTTDLRVRGEHDTEGPPGAETAERIIAVTEQAHARGMRVMLKPHIWIRGGKWRGRIKPLAADGTVDWATWWDSHDDWIMHYARLAAQQDIASLVIGLELHTAVQAHPERLVALAGKVREVYAGHVTYSANWNEPVGIDVWRALDSVGVQFYPPLSNERGAWDETSITKKLRAELDRWGAVADAVQKPLIITEVGYRAADIAVSHPNAWPEKMKADRNDSLQEQAYRSFFDELGRTKRLGGVFIWKYFTNQNTDEGGPTGFTPLGKPAEAVLRTAYSGD